MLWNIIPVAGKARNVLGLTGEIGFNRRAWKGASIMKFTFGWLREHLETTKTLDEIVVALTALGLEVDAVEDQAKLYAPFFVAAVEKADKHPDADRLKVLTVDTGKGKVQVVCGAPNARAGMKGVFAPEGSYIPGTDTVLKKGNIRGVDSCGMMVSEREMALSDAHEGIIEIAGDVPIGTPFAEIYGLSDPVIEIGLTPNRADCAGIRGIARDLAAAGHGTLKPVSHATPTKGIFTSPIGINLAFDSTTSHYCPLFLGRLIRGVKNHPSPKDLHDKLSAVGQKPISALVDITNYMTLGLNRPLHVFDADKIKGHLHVRASKKGESFVALNGKTYTLDDGMVVVCDDSGVLALGGVIGGESTAVSDTTTNVYIESAFFDPLRTARTGRALQIDSDARYRFERGIDPAFTVDGMDIATNLVMTLCGGEASEIVTAGAVPQWQRRIDFDPDSVEKLAGYAVPVEQQITILNALGFNVQKNGSMLSVQPPSWRGDVEGRTDLVEEIIRVIGLDRMPSISVPKQGPMTQSAETTAVTRSRRARTILAGRGLDECITWSFMDHNLAEKFGANDCGKAAALTLANPISSELDFMRPSILPNLIAAAARNADRGYPDAALFEVGPVFETPKVTGQRLCAAGIRSGIWLERHWSTRDTNRPVDAYDAKADALAVLAAAGLPAEAGQITRDAPPWYHPGRSGIIRLGTNILARFGEIHPQILEDMKITFPVAGFEVFLDAIPQPRNKGTTRSLLHLSPLQPLSRDFAFIVDAGIEADTLLRAARGADKTLIADARIFDVYQGKGVEAGKKSVAIAVTLEPREKTLTDKEIEDICTRIINSVTTKTGGQLRA